MAWRFADDPGPSLASTGHRDRWLKLAFLFACRADWRGPILFAGAALMYGAFSAVRGRLAAA